ncbi:hemopexin repeat-containing protein [Nocardia sp. NPDC056611]|uniref:hemopexin repeat-containing protein n=1 Tax=Nocardia sp. NPDC056611 TaxID=3345877 RepID=UPI00366BAE42
MPIDAALDSGTKTYFFNGGQYIRVTRGDTGAGAVDPGYPADISAWGWPAGFGNDGIDAAFRSGPKCYFFSGSRYIRVTRGDTGAGTVDPGYPKHIDSWGWPGRWATDGIDAAFRRGDKTYFFAGSKYIRVTRGDTGAGTVDPGYPQQIAGGWPLNEFGRDGIDAALYSGTKIYYFKGSRYIRVNHSTGLGNIDAGYPADISAWGWPTGFDSHMNGIDAALYSGSKCYFFNGGKYIRVTRGDTGPGTVDPGYPADISAWQWPEGFGTDGIDAAHHSNGWSKTTTGTHRSRTYFFAGNEFISVARGDTGSGTLDPGYPGSIAALGLTAYGFGNEGIDATLYSGSKCYFFKGGRYIRVTRGETGAGTVDPGYPADISAWHWPASF